MNIFFSASTLWFYDLEDKEKYEAGIGWPADAAEITDEEWKTYTSTPPDGYVLGANSQGTPTWIVIPPPTHDELVSTAEAEKQSRIEQANDYINSKQWPGKAAIGRLKDDELAQYNLWLDYLDVLEEVDTSTAPNIDWPISPLQ